LQSPLPVHSTQALVAGLQTGVEPLHVPLQGAVVVAADVVELVPPDDSPPPDVEPPTLVPPTLVPPTFAPPRFEVAPPEEVSPPADDPASLAGGHVLVFRQLSASFEHAPTRALNARVAAIVVLNVVVFIAALSS